MRPVLAAALLIGVVSMTSVELVGAGPEAEKAASPMNLYYGPQDAHRVTIRTERGATAVIDFPKGVLLGFVVPQAGNPSVKEALMLPSSFHGDLQILARREDEVSPDESTSASEIMATAPVVMQLKGATVGVQRIAEPQE